MKNIFSQRFRKKSELDLIAILENREKYQKEAIEAAFEELRNRKILDQDTSPDISAEELGTIRAEILERRIAENNSTVEERNKENDPPEWQWLPAYHIMDLIGYYAFAAILVISLSFPFFNAFKPSFLFYVVYAILPLWQVNAITEPKYKRAFHFHSRAIFGIAMVFIPIIRNYLVNGYGNYSYSIFIFLLFVALSGLISLPLFHIPGRIISRPKYFLHWFKWSIPVAGVFLFVMIMFEENWFLYEKKVPWSDTYPLTYDDFEGYPQLFSDYDAGISSTIDYEFDKNDNIVKVDAVCYKNYSWMNPWDKGNSYFLLQHEQYHFNITEVMTRMTRKRIMDTLKLGSDRKGLEIIIKSQFRLLNDMQDQYDEETAHSVKSDVQSMWQYKIDSMLSELDPYWSSVILSKNSRADTIKYFRNIRINEHNDFLGSNELMPFEQNYAAHYRFIYSGKELVQVEYYFHGKPAVDNTLGASVVKIRRSWDKTTWKFYNADSQPILCADGYFKKVIKKKNFNELDISYFDVNDDPCTNESGAFMTHVRLNKSGKNSEVMFYNRSGQQIRTGDGYFLLKYDYSDLLTYSVKNYDQSDSPLADKGGVFEKVYQYDEEGNLIKTLYRNEIGNYAYVDGHAAVEYTHNELGYLTEIRYLDEYGQLSENQEGIAKYTFSSDRYGNYNRTSTYNSNNVLKEDEGGIATTYKAYNEGNRLILWADYGTGDNLIFDSSLYGKAKYKYDNLGRRTHLINYNGYDYPVRSESSGPVEKYTYDSLNRIVKTNFLNHSFLPDTADRGEAFYTYKYDEEGNVAEASYYDLSGSLKAVDNNAAIFRYLYDKNKNKIEVRCYSVDSTLTNSSDNVSIYRYKHSKNGNIIEKSYYDTLDRLTTFKGSAKIKWMYDERGNEVEVSYFNKENELIDTGVAIVRYKYDAQNKKVEEHKFNADEKSIENGPAITRYLYENGLYKGLQYYNGKGQPHELKGIFMIYRTHDARKNIVEEKYFNKRKRLVKDNTGVALIKYEHDLYDRIIKEEFYDADLKLTLKNGKYAIIEYKRLPSGDIAEKRFYNEDNQVASDENNVSIYKFQYDRNGSVSSTDSVSYDRAVEIGMLLE